MSEITASYSIDWDKSKLEFQGTAEGAVRRAALGCYLAPHDVRQHAERLIEGGRTAWAYGFASVVVRLEAF